MLGDPTAVILRKRRSIRLPRQGGHDVVCRGRLCRFPKPLDERHAWPEREGFGPSVGANPTEVTTTERAYACELFGDRGSLLDAVVNGARLAGESVVLE